jgi:hypothetical protein
MIRPPARSEAGSSCLLQENAQSFFRPSIADRTVTVAKVAHDNLELAHLFLEMRHAAQAETNLEAD